MENAMLKLGDMIYFVENGEVHSGKIIELDEDTFELDGYGCCCEGNCKVSRSMIGYNYFSTAVEAEKRL